MSTAITSATLPQGWPLLMCPKLEAFIGYSASRPGLSPSLYSPLSYEPSFFLEAFGTAIASVKMRCFRGGLQHRTV